MKYIGFLVFALIILCLCTPVWVITWDWDGRTNGWFDIIDGVEKMFGIEQ